MFDADDILREPFIHNEIIRYRRVAALIPFDMPLVMIAPAFTSTKNGTDLLSNVMSMTPDDAWQLKKAHRWDAYIGSCWIDAPTVAISLISSKSNRIISL